MLRRVMVALAFVFAVSGTAAAQSLLLSQESKFPVKETADRLAKAIEEKGLKVAARVDHAAGAKAAGMEMLPAEVVLFGNPKLGTPLMLSNPESAIDLPMKMLVWQDKTGKVWIGYVAPDALKVRYGINDRDEVFKTMTGALAGLAKAASGAN